MQEIFKKIITFILIAESRLVLWKYKPKIVAITGSVGKTSTKDAVYAVLSKVSYVRKSEKSYNSEIGLPLTILGCPNGWYSPYAWLKNILAGAWLFLFPHEYPKWLVLEAGIGKPGDMEVLASWLKSDVVIITAIGETPAHIEFFKSREDVIEEKSKLIKTLKKDGVLVLNRDDEAVLNMKEKSKNRVITFGFKEGADVLGSSDSILYGESGEPQGVIFRVDEGGNSLPVSIEGVFGRNHVYASLAALALSFALKLNILNAINALKNYEVPPGRVRLLSGINNSMIIDDTYNSSPTAAVAALEILGEVKTKGRKIAVLGDMLELGRHTEEAHKKLGALAKEKAHILVVVGPRAVMIKNGALEAGMKLTNKRDRKGEIFEFLNSKDAGEFLKTFVKKNDLVLIKGSQGIRMERAVEAILLDQENKDNLLVRQDNMWQKI